MRGPGARGTRSGRARSRPGGEWWQEKGVGARAVQSSSCWVLAGILFWSRGRVGRASRGAEQARDPARKSRAARALGERGKEGTRV